MKPLTALALLSCAASARAEFAFDLRETISGHPSLVLKTVETTSHMVILGGKIAKIQNQIVQIVDNENNLLTLIDYRDKKFATSSLAEAQRNRDLQFDQQFPQDIRIELVKSGQPAEWDGRSVKRDVFLVKINSEPGPGEWLYTVDSSTAPPPDFSQTSSAMASTEEHYDQELDAEIQTLGFMNMDRFKDIQKARKEESPKNTLVLHTLAEFRLKKGAALLETIGQQFADRPVITKEIEVVDFRLAADDTNVFAIPPEFEQVDMHELLVQQDIRANR